MGYRTIVTFSLVLCLHLPALGEMFTVTDQQEFVAVLEKAADNRQDDEIRVLYGVNVLPVEYQREPGYALRIVGGYAPDFQSRVGGQEDKPEVSAAPLLPGTPEPQKSTTGPIPDPSVKPKAAFDSTSATVGTGGVESVLGVPGYLWRHGCGPTAVGMVAGYYDIRGYRDLFTGSAYSQTEGVDQGIASERDTGDPGHYEDYSLPLDSAGNVQPDKSEPGQTAHASDSIADFMRTSWSVDDMPYGGSYSNRIAPSLVAYAALKNPDYTIGYINFYMQYTPVLTWDVLTTLIDNGYPMVFLVDSDGNGETDHFVAVVGYRDSPRQQYGCLDTWPEADTVRWCNFLPMASGVPWGIFGGTVFDFPPLPAPPDLSPMHLLLLGE